MAESFTGDNVWTVALVGLVLLLVGAGAGYGFSLLARRSNLGELEKEAQHRAKQRLAEEERSQRLVLLEEKDDWYKTKTEQEKDLENQLLEINQREKSFTQRERDLNHRREELRKEWDRFKAQEKRVGLWENGLKESEAKVKVTLEEYRSRLEMVANLTSDEARDQLLEHVSGEVRGRVAGIIRAERIRAKEESEREAKKIIALAIQRCAVEEAEQVSTSTVSLPNEGLKSRIIGKEGRNVRSFENATGVKVVVDDTPDTVLISSFDPAKRAVASKAMARLIADGGFTPGRIEDVVAQCKVELEEDMVRSGRNALAEIGSKEDLHADLPQYVGMLKYRTSYGQNLLQHCLEVAHLSGLMAAEVGLDVRLARRAGLLHDIGKTVSREMEGSHVELGIELGERFAEHPVVREVIAEHHEDNERLSSICFIVKAADTISSIRPGGRREDLEGYARRIMKLEETATSFDGVKDVYAINAGREIRVMVRGEKISDDDAEILAFDIAERVKNELTFAGQVKVMVVRETRAVRYTGRNRPRRQAQNQVRNGNPRSKNRRGRSGPHAN